MDPTFLRTFRAHGYDQHAKRDGQIPLTTSPRLSLSSHSKALQSNQPSGSKEITSRIHFRDKQPCSRSYKKSHYGRRLEPACNSCRKRKTRCDLSSSEHAYCSECVARGVECWPKETRVQTELRTERQAHSLTKEALSRAQTANATLQIPHWSNHGHSRHEPGARCWFRNLNVGGQLKYCSSNSNIQNSSLDTGPTQQEQQLYADEYNVILFKHSMEKSVSACYSWPLIREILPALEDFQEHHNELYSSTSTKEDQSSFKSLLFALLALGSLTFAGGDDFRNLTASHGRIFADRASKLFHDWRQNFTVQHCRCALLLSIYYAESTDYIAARLWVAQAFALISELWADEPSAIDYENLSRDLQAESNLANFLIYWDSALSLGSLRRPLIRESFFNLSPSGGGGLNKVTSSVSSQLHRIVPVVKQTLELRKDKAYEKFKNRDSSVSMYAQDYPGPLSHEAFDPAEIQAKLLYSSALLLYHRERFVHSKDLDHRLAVLEQCVQAAEVMSAMIEGSFPGSSRKQEPIWQWTLLHPNWERNIRWLASSLFCRHLWRCVVVFCVAKRYKAALLCVQVSCTIGSLRNVNTICGESLVGFLHHLARRYCFESDDTKSLLTDEELVSAIVRDADEKLNREFVDYSHGSDDVRESTGMLEHAPKTMKEVGIPEKYEDDWREAEHWLMMFGKHEEGIESLFED